MNPRSRSRAKVLPSYKYQLLLFARVTYDWDVAFVVIKSLAAAGYTSALDFSMDIADVLSEPTFATSIETVMGIDCSVEEIVSQQVSSHPTLAPTPSPSHPPSHAPAIPAQPSEAPSTRPVISPSPRPTITQPTSNPTPQQTKPPSIEGGITSAASTYIIGAVVLIVLVVGVAVLCKAQSSNTNKSQEQSLEIVKLALGAMGNAQGGGEVEMGSVKSRSRPLAQSETQSSEARRKWGKAKNAMKDGKMTKETSLDVDDEDDEIIDCVRPVTETLLKGDLPSWFARHAFFGLTRTQYEECITPILMEAGVEKLDEMLELLDDEEEGGEIVKDLARQLKPAKRGPFKRAVDAARRKFKKKLAAAAESDEDDFAEGDSGYRKPSRRSSSIPQSKQIARAALHLEAAPFAQGAAGQIFKGAYKGEEIAAKLVMSSSGDHEDFDHEVSMLINLSHPNIVELKGICNDNDFTSFMVMEFCGGGDLAAYYKLPAFNCAEFFRISSELISGITYLHQCGIAHRDLKPNNVLLTTARTVKIADFGLAKITAGTITRGIGTPAYMAPELLNDDISSDELSMFAVDVYAIGIVLWQLWFKKSPFEGKNIHVIMSRVSTGKRPQFDQDASHPMPPALLQALIESCWAHVSGDRPSIKGVFASFARVENEIMLLAESGQDIANIKNNEEDSLALTRIRQRRAARRRASQEGPSAAVPAATPPAEVNKFTKAGESLEEFLGAVNLAKLAPALRRQGFDDVETLSDRDLLTDDLMSEMIGMTKLEIRRLRKHIKSQESGPTMLRQREQQPRGKEDPVFASEVSLEL